MFNRLHTYTVHLKNDKSGEMKDMVFVREGFNFIAFALGIFWAMYHRSWLFAQMIFMWMLVVQLMETEQVLNPLSLGIMQLGLMVMFGFLANDSLRDTLARRGYEQKALVTGESKTRAELRYFDQYAITA